MTYKYETISQREWIEDENIATIVDYIERHSSKNIDYIEIDDLYIEIRIWDHRYYFDFFDNLLSIYKNDLYDWWDDYDAELIMTIPIKLFADNIVALYAWIKNLWKQ